MRQLSLLLLASLVACGPSEFNARESKSGAISGAEARLVVATVNYPLAFFAEWIGEQAVEVEFPAPAQEDPAFWSPDAETIQLYQDADLILLNGAGYAKWVDRASLPSSRTVNTSATQSERLIEIDSTVTHAHGPQGEHSHGTTAFTTWLDLSFAIEQARTINFALADARPHFKESFERNFAALELELRALDERWMAIVAADPERPLLGSHPVYQYLEARYGLRLESVHWEPDVVPDDDMLRELESVLESHPAHWMLWESEPLPETVVRLTELGIGSIVFNPCANSPEGTSDFLDVMRANARALDQVFGEL